MALVLALPIFPGTGNQAALASESTNTFEVNMGTPDDPYRLASADGFMHIAFKTLTISLMFSRATTAGPSSEMFIQQETETPP